MTGIRRTYTSKNAGANDTFLLIELTNDVVLAINRSVVEALGEGSVNAQIVTFRSQNDVEMSAGVHFNRDGSLCWWTGTPPDVWPEDEPEIP